MSKQVTLLRVFVASPENLKEEKALLDKAVHEMNNIWDKENILLKIVKWETDISGMVKNSQININEYADDYDIFIGIIWKRFSNPKQPNLGIVDKFNNAINRFTNNPNSISVMFYFNNVPIRPNDIDIEQLTLINNFKTTLKENKIPYWEYTGVEDFYPLIKKHLTQQIQEIKTRLEIDREINIISSEDSTIKDLSEIIEEAQEEGFLDLIEEGNENMDIFVSVLQRISKAIETLGERVAKRGTELNQIQPSDIKLAKNIFKQTADDMGEFVESVDPEIQTFSTTYLKGIRALTQAATLTNDFSQNENQILVSLRSVQSMKNEIIKALGSIIEFREAVSNLPRFTRDITIAKKRALLTLDNLINEMYVAKDLASESERILEKAMLNS